MSGKPLRHNMAKVEFLGCLESVVSMLAQGFSKRIIYEKLLEQKRLSMAYVTFCKLSVKATTPSPPALVQPNAAPDPIKVENPPPLTRPEVRPGPRIVNSAKEPFPDPRKMRLEDGI